MAKGGCGTTASIPILVAAITVSMFLNVFLLVFSDHHDSQYGTPPCKVQEHLEEFFRTHNKNGASSTARRATALTAKKTTTAKGSSSSSSSSSHHSVSACLLLKDDNDILNEWIAYHYHTLDMRYLVVAVDPSSLTSPQEVLNRWQQHSNLRAVIWQDTDYMPADFLEKGYHIPPRFIKADANSSKWHHGDEDPEQVRADKMKIQNHRYRQVTFISACFRHVRAMNRTWTVHVDTDEFMVVNPVFRKRTKNAPLIPSVGEPSSVASLLHHVEKDVILRKKSNIPCISMPRLLFGAPADQQTPEAAAAVTAPSGFVGSRFETLRWRDHAAYTDRDRNAQPKVIVDVSKVPFEDEMFQVKPFSIHRPSKALCRRIDQMDFEQDDLFPFTVNHYVGTYARYNARNDVRHRDMTTYQFKANATAGGHDAWITDWFPGFVKTQGQERASILLQEYTTTAPVAKNDAVVALTVVA